MADPKFRKFSGFSMVMDGFSEISTEKNGLNNYSNNL
jgi:hypothetical protein